MTYRKMPIGIDDYKKLVEGNYYFIDKTNFIMSLIDGHSDVTLITRPRRFGKTLTMSMLRYFYNNDNVLENRKLFDKCEIGKPENKRYMSEQGKYPVLFLTFKDINADNYDSMKKQFDMVISDVYGRHRDIMSELAEDEVDYYNKALRCELSEEELRFSLKRLTDYLYKFYQEKVVVLIDEYDAPIQHAYDADSKYYHEAIDFVKGLMGTVLKTNDRMNFAILTGVLRIAKESIFSDLNNLDVCSVVSDKYSDVFGFNNDDIDQILKDYNLPDKKAEIIEWYDGYHFGSSNIYNPWSVIKYIDNNCKTQAYWINTSSYSILSNSLGKDGFPMEEFMEKLFNGEPVSAWIDEGVIYDEIGQNSNKLFTMLLNTGYLTPDSDYEENGEEYKLVIPNKEVSSVFKREILGRMTDNRSSEVENTLVDKLLSGDPAELEKALSDFILKYVSYFDAGTEGFYHGMMLGILSMIFDTHKVCSNKESGLGRFDIALFPKKADGIGVILEFKKSDKEDALEKNADEALNQIIDNKYDTEFASERISNVKKYGISFCGKKICVR
ncbi:AAA family ATPase [Butyrivibrio proteoclasticus]|uniref:AAA family ATPase n=1 Tax=Butyrivibrio proteoclasticus TaxID=43305 RepID=UPI00047C050F|nr:AAA family ATPase [Butyrivibrio proteoclasticus]